LGRKRIALLLVIVLVLENREKRKPRESFFNRGWTQMGLILNWRGIKPWVNRTLRFQAIKDLRTA
jgi:hypothetical protein